MRAVAAVLALLALANPAAATFLRVVDDQDPGGYTFMSAVAPVWTGDIARRGGDPVPAPCGVRQDGWPAWTVHLAVDAWPLAKEGNLDHFHARAMGADVVVTGTPQVTWAFEYEGGPQQLGATLAAEVVALPSLDPLAEPAGHVVARGHHAVPPGPGGRFLWNLELVEPTIPKGSYPVLNVDLRRDWGVATCWAWLPHPWPHARSPTPGRSQGWTSGRRTPCRWRPRLATARRSGSGRTRRGASDNWRNPMPPA